MGKKIITYQNNKTVTHFGKRNFRNKKKKKIFQLLHLLLLQSADTHDIITSFIMTALIKTGHTCIGNRHCILIQEITSN